MYPTHAEINHVDFMPVYFLNDIGTFFKRTTNLRAWYARSGAWKNKLNKCRMLIQKSRRTTVFI